MNSQLFEKWFENNLLRELPSKSVIVMDNAAFHRKKQLALIAQNNGLKVLLDDYEILSLTERPKQKLEALKILLKLEHKKEKLFYSST